MISRYILALCCMVTFGMCSGVRAAGTVSLLDLDQVSGSNLPGVTQQVSVADHIYQQLLTPGDFEDEADGVYNLNGKFTRLQGAIGVKDGDDAAQPNRTYSIFVDGKEVVQGSTDPGDQPIPVDVDLTGASSLRIVLSAHAILADPVLTKVVPPSPTVPLLIAPANASEIDGPTIVLRWEPVRGAVSYGVEIECIHLASGSADMPKVYAYNSRTNTLTLDAGTFGAGTYSWQVVAFSRKKPMGSFSRAWSFTIDR